MGVIDSALDLGMKCADSTAAENFRRLWGVPPDYTLTTFTEPRWKQFSGVIEAIVAMKHVVEKEPSVPATLRNEIKDALSKKDITKLEEEARNWIEICNLIQKGAASDAGTYDLLVEELSQKLGKNIDDIRPAFEKFRESFRNSASFRRVQEVGQSTENRELLKTCPETFAKCMNQISQNRIFLISQEALLFIYENYKDLKERKCLLVLYGLETTMGIVNQIIYQCVIDGGIPEFDTDHDIVKVAPSYGILVNDISLTLAIFFHPGLKVGSIFKIKAEHMPRYAIALGLAHHFHNETGSYMDISGLALDEDGFAIPLPSPSQPKT